ncbi:MAG: hypothetical protein SP1CHLAM54_09840 [Chlamydiia bacterium]|nr:hypothetical protein [Chlamydiia bacterium]MCH9615890.1 hypothetical protein [Chlamydiia bacterium]MCH9628707.1 hypothetical protein [Chlamydiia bacterium]
MRSKAKESFDGYDNKKETDPSDIPKTRDASE